jgi:hypothetical protein
MKGAHQDSLRLTGATILALMNAEVDSRLNEFNLLAIQYFALFKGPATERTAWLRRIEIAIADLYAAGLRLPVTEPSDRDAPTMPVEDSRRLAIDISQRLGGDSTPYSIVFHPRDLNETPVVGRWSTISGAFTRISMRAPRSWPPVARRRRDLGVACQLSDPLGPTCAGSVACPSGHAQVGLTSPFLESVAEGWKDDREHRTAAAAVVSQLALVLAHDGLLYEG